MIFFISNAVTRKLKPGDPNDCLSLGYGDLYSKPRLLRETGTCTFIRVC